MSFLQTSNKTKACKRRRGYQSVRTVLFLFIYLPRRWTQAPPGSSVPPMMSRKASFSSSSMLLGEDLIIDSIISSTDTGGECVCILSCMRTTAGQTRKAYCIMWYAEAQQMQCSSYVTQTHLCICFLPSSSHAGLPCCNRA